MRVHPRRVAEWAYQPLTSGLQSGRLDATTATRVGAATKREDDVAQEDIGHGDERDGDDAADDAGDRCPGQHAQQHGVDKVVMALLKQQPTPGMRVKPIEPEKFYYEARVNDGDRVIHRVHDGTVYFVDIVVHDEIGTYGKRPPYTRATQLSGSTRIA